MEHKYKSVEGSHISDAEAEVYGRRIDELKSNGEVTPECLLEDAKDKNSPLHAYFEWNNKRAANTYRIEQARYLLRSIVVVVDITNKRQSPTRAFYNVTNNQNESVYVDLDKVMSNPDYKEQVIRYAFSQLLGWQEKYLMYKEFRPVFNAIKVVSKKVK